VCVLLLHVGLRDDAPVVLLANRDEDYARTFRPPARWDDPPGLIAPRDDRGGGTWLGVNATGLVVAITNRVTRTPRSNVRSRGQLVLDVLRRRDADDAARFVEEHLAATEYDVFNLVVVDRRRGFLVQHRACETETAPLARGVHLLTNLHEPGEVPLPAAGAPQPGEPLDALRARPEVLAADRETPMPGDHRICKVGRTRGTVCSAVLALPASPRDPPRLRFAFGPPHLTPFVDVPTS